VTRAKSLWTLLVSQLPGPLLLLVIPEIHGSDFYLQPSSQNILRQILRGIDHTHSHMVLHRDIKPENVLIKQASSSDDSSAANAASGDGAFIVKVTDFGLARQYLPPRQEYTAKVGKIGR